MNIKVLLYLKSVVEVIWKHRLDFFLWLLFVVIAGQLGTIINFINRCVFDGWALSQSLLADSVSGNFYTFALVLVTSTIGNIFIKLTLQPDYITINITLLLFLQQKGVRHEAIYSSFEKDTFVFRCR